jgi:hypothetical protein
MTTFYILLLLLSIPVITMLVMMSQDRKWWKFIFILIPISLFLVYKLWFAIEYIKTAPTTKMPDKFTFIHSIEKQKKHIFIWGIEEGKDYPITVVIPWSEKASKEVEKAKRGVREGRAMARNKAQERENGTPSDEFKFYEFRLGSQYMKMN